MPMFPDHRSRVHEGDALVTFYRKEQEEEVASYGRRREILQEEYDLIQSHPLEIDPSVLRAHERARGAIVKLEQQERNLLEERDAMVRDAPRQKLDNDSRRNRIDLTLSQIQHEVEQARVFLATARKGYDSAENLYKDGLVSQRELDLRNETLEISKSRLEQLLERQQMLEDERGEVNRLLVASEDTYDELLDSRQQYLFEVRDSLESARGNFVGAEDALTEDKGRARSIRDKRLRQIAIQIEECDAFLGEPGKTIAVDAPWDALVGFRTTSPASHMNDGSPLLVLYQPEQIWVRLHVTASQAQSMVGGDMKIALHALTSETMNKVFYGTILEATPLLNEVTELRIACDPPEAAIREVATGGTVPVSVNVRRTSTNFGWPLGLALGALVALPVTGIARRRRRGDNGAGPVAMTPPTEPTPPAPAPPAFTPPVPPAPAPAAPETMTVAPPVPTPPTPPVQQAPETMAVTPTAPPAPVAQAPPGSGFQGELAEPGHDEFVEFDPTRGTTVSGEIVREHIPAPPPPALPTAGYFATPIPAEPATTPESFMNPVFEEAPTAGAAAAQPIPQPVEIPVEEAPAPQTPVAEPPSPELSDLGVHLKESIADGSVSADVVLTLDEVLRAEGFGNIATIAMGFGATPDAKDVSDAGCVLLGQGIENSVHGRDTLERAVGSCAAYVRILRMLGDEELHGTLDHLRGGLMAAARLAAVRQGWSGERLDSLLAPLSSA
jgi:hypothetical protein